MASKPKKAPAEGPSGARRITLVAPIADAVEAVVATGDFTNWSPEGIPLKRGRDGAWSTTLQLSPGEYQYRLIVDGEWQNNPAADRRATNPFGGLNDVLIVS